MIRYDLEFMPSLAGSDSEMVMRADGDWVLHVSHIAEVRQTQRRMIAALYWRAGEAQQLADASHMHSEMRAYIGARNALILAARAMEAACAR